MENYVAPEIPGYARQIIKSLFGAKEEVNSFEWTGGQIFNKVYCLNTTEGRFVLKIQCDRIFFSTRKEQIENEVLGGGLFRGAGIPCPAALDYDFTGKNIGVRYVLSECVDSESYILMGAFENFDEARKAEINRQAAEMFGKLRSITSGAFGGLFPDSVLGRHDAWDGYYRAAFELLIRDSEEYGVFSGEELGIVKEAAKKPLTYAKKYAPSFVTGDLGEHNAIWGSVGGGPDKLYFIDFGNAYFGLPYTDEYMVRKFGGFGFQTSDLADEMGLDKRLYENLLSDFERMWFVETMRLTEDYAHCGDWMTSLIESAKKDASRKHIVEFVDKCREFIA